MQDLKFCAKCGRKTLQWDGEKKWTCSNCDYNLFHNVAGAVAVLLILDDEILFTRRNQNPKKSFLDLPGGFVDPKESAEQSCVRELYEEMKINLTSDKLRYLGSLPNVYQYKNISYNTLDLFYEYSVSEKYKFSLEQTEISEVIWLKKTEINIEDIAFDSQKIFLKKYLISS